MIDDIHGLRHGWIRAGWLLLLAIAMVESLGAGPDETGAPDPRVQVPSPQTAFEPAAPELPAAIVAALQEKRYEAAIQALREKRAADAPAEERAYLGLIEGIAHRLNKTLDQAAETLGAALEIQPDGVWSAKIEGELAVVFLASGRFQEAEALARRQAERLLEPSRKDGLAGIYRELAGRLLEPSEPTISPDPEAAHALLEQARSLAQGEGVRAELLLAMAEASRKAGQNDRSIQEYQLYLDTYRHSPDGQQDVDPSGRDRARFGLGEAQLAAGQSVPARLTWEAFVRDAEPSERSTELHARALFQISRTYGIPEPGDTQSLNLGVGALKRYLERYPAGESAVRASFEIAQSYLHLGRSAEALDAFRTYIAGGNFRAETEDARRVRAELDQEAAYRVGQILAGQEQLDAAVDSFLGYLAQYPNGPYSGDAQRAILETRLRIAERLAAGKQFEPAREAWQRFVSDNPLDARVPEILFRVGQSYLEQEPKAVEDAIKAWQILVGKFPGTEASAHARYEIARLHETEKRDPAGAIERYKKVDVEPWASQARQRIAVMEAKALTVVTPRAFRSGETPKLEITSRNLKTLTFTAYKLNPETYFRKKLKLGGVESLDIGLVAPDAEWSVEVPEFVEYTPIKTSYEIKVDLPGVYVVKVTDENNLQATTIVVGTDIEAIVKASRDQVLVFAQDMTTGRGRPNVRVLLAAGDQVRVDGRTGEDGVLLTDWGAEGLPETNPLPLSYLILDGPNAAGNALAGWDAAVSEGLSARAYLYTDRPAYRPGQRVQLRGVVREAADGRYAIEPGSRYRLEVTDSRGRPFVAKEVALSEFGTFDATIDLDAAAPVGSYTVRVYRPGGSEFTGNFQVQAYQLQKIDLEFDLPRTVYYRGEPIQGTVVARYQYGTPLAGRPIEVHLPDGRTLRGSTDDEGRFPFEAETEGYAQTQPVGIRATLPMDDVSATSLVVIAVQAFEIRLGLKRTTYLDDEPFPVEITTLDALGEPTGQELVVRLLKRLPAPAPIAPPDVPVPQPAPAGFPSMPVQADSGPQTEREVSETTVRTDPKTGKATITLTVDDDEGGDYLVRAAGTDRFGNPITAVANLMISGSKDEQKLRILAETNRFKVGETASFRLHSRLPEGVALLTWEADRILQYRLMTVREGENTVSWDVEGSQFPNFTLTASRIHEQRLDQAQIDVLVTRDLNITIKPSVEAIEPGREFAVEIETRDQIGNPVSAELSIAMVDNALLRLFDDPMPPIGAFFYSQERRGIFTTEATNTFFPYRPPTTPVPQAVVEERLRGRALSELRSSIEVARQQAQGQVAMGLMAESGDSQMMENMLGMPAAAAPAPASEAALGDVMGRRLRREADMAGRPARDGRIAGMMGGMGGYGFAEAGEKEDFKAGGDFDSLNMAFEGLQAFAKARVPSAPPSRELFVETAYWNPNVVTGPDGKATITITSPSSLSRYQFKARGVTGAETLVGEATAEIRVRKDFFVELKSPPTLMEGDTPRFQARLHHQSVKGTVEIALRVYAGDREQVFRRTVDLARDGVEEVLFDPFPIPITENVRLDLSARTAGGDGPSDALTVEVPVRPWGVEAYATASGSSSEDTTAFVRLPGGRRYEDPEMLVVLSPSVRRLLFELALGRDAYPLERRSRIGFPEPPHTIIDRASDLLAAASALSYLRANGHVEAPEAVRLESRVRGLVSELVTLQNDDGGWPWVASGDPGKSPAGSDRMTSAHVVWALATAEPLVTLPDPRAMDRATDYVTQQFAQAEANDTDTRAALLHALSSRRRANFEQANSLNRIRQGLSDAALGYLALTFVNLDRSGLAVEILDVLSPRAKLESVAPNAPPRRYWEGASGNAGLGGRAEATALVALALARSRPEDPLLAGAVEWLLAHRVGTGWRPHKVDGPALAALARYYGDARQAEDHYRLTVSVNDTEVFAREILGNANGEMIAVPRSALKLDGENLVRFDIEGRGTFGYAITMTGFTTEFGPDQDRANRSFLVTQQVFMPAEPEFEGRPLPTGFVVSIGSQIFENRARQVGLGARARVRIDAHRIYRAGQPAWEREFLVLESQLPAGTTLVDGSVRTSAGHHELVDGVLTFYFAPDVEPGQIYYDVYGYLPGEYRTRPPRIWSAYDPGKRHMASSGTFDLKVLAPGEPNTDPYRPTPDELYARGKALYEAGRRIEAAQPLQSLWDGYTLTDEVARDAARMLLYGSIEARDSSRIVQFFEVLKEKNPDLVIPFDKVLAVGRAYTDIGEFERAYLVWRGVIDASYIEDARLGELLRQRGRPLEAVALLLDLWRAHPNSEAIKSDLFGLSQVMASLATQAIDIADVRQALLQAGKSRADLLLQAIALVQVFQAQAPDNPLADEASLALVGNFLELEDYASVVKLSERYAALYKTSRFLDSFQYSEALGRFHLGEYDRAIEVAEAIARATYKDESGVDRPSPNKWQALYIIGQIHDARRQADQAVAYYRQVADQFTDAADSVQALTQKRLQLPEVTVIRPKTAPEVAAPEEPALRAVPVDGQATAIHDGKIVLTYRNLGSAEVKVYPVDLMRLYLTRRNLDGIAGIDLAGITPLIESAVTLEGGLSYEVRTKVLELPLEKEGAYLIMVRGEDLYASGIALVTPLDLEVREEPASGRVRVRVSDARTGDPLEKVAVKVIGSAEQAFHSGETDLRGVFTADQVRGEVTVLARQDAPERENAPRYAFHRGKTFLGQPLGGQPGQQAPPHVDGPRGIDTSMPSLEQNLKMLNTTNQMQQLKRLEERFQQAPESGVNIQGIK